MPATARSQAISRISSPCGTTFRPGTWRRSRQSRGRSGGDLELRLPSHQAGIRWLAAGVPLRVLIASRDASVLERQRPLLVLFGVMWREPRSSSRRPPTREDEEGETARREDPFPRTHAANARHEHNDCGQGGERRAKHEITSRSAHDRLDSSLMVQPTQTSRRFTKTLVSRPTVAERIAPIGYPW
jgi:hypothetical protein